MDNKGQQSKSEELTDFFGKHSDENMLRTDLY